MTKLTHFNEWKDLEFLKVGSNIVFAKSNLQHFFKQANACWYTGRYATGGLIHLLRYSQDGGLLTNNPCSIAIHEARLLWPDEPFQCIVSIGTGKYKGRSGPSAVEFSSLREKLLKIVASATDTEGKFWKTGKKDLLKSSYSKFLSFELGNWSY